MRLEAFKKIRNHRQAYCCCIRKTSKKTIKRTTQGFKISFTVFADNSELARIAAQISLWPELVTNCRSFKLLRSDSRLLGLAPNTLKALSYEPRGTKLDTRVFRTMSSVTKLELINKALEAKADLTHLQRLPLEELILIDCPSADSAILVQGAFNQLKRIHIDGCEREHNFHYYSPASDDDAGYETSHSTYVGSEGDRMSSVLQSLPHLERVSGRSHLFCRGLYEFLEEWHLVWHDDHETITLSNKEKSSIPVWTKL